ncbi:sodium/potassium-transporting ATPase subunit beta-2 [Anabrus simplex]|uniref:sodium/potassium-transporting ATPase subunit beta-2 n=1 Tax=Anabrus simplex TaxID=316456 RepID=UPI0034DD34E5
MAEKPVEQYYTRPPKLGKWEGFRTFMWNSETSQFFGRTGASWAKILLFYVLFYVSLLGFFFAMLAIFYQTIDLHTPKWQLENSLIGSNPGLGFRPMPPESNVESTLIWYRSSDSENYKYWVEELDKFLEVYRKPNTLTSGGENRQICDYTSDHKGEKVCDVMLSLFGNCTKENKYSYHRASPCIFLKINKIFNWIPDYYNDTESLPENMPKDLKTFIGTRSQNEMNTVWVSCEGENPADVENIGPIQYYPTHGFPGFYFPYKNLDGYLSPIVAVWFKRPTTGVLINIECKAWARNIHHDRQERRGSVHFELMVD